jgi:DNA-binding transcriptional regulator YiaG
LTGAELRRTRLRLDLTQVELANVLEVTSDTVSRWERGAHRVPGAVALAMEALAARAGFGPNRKRRAE